MNKRLHRPERHARADLHPPASESSWRAFIGNYNLLGGEQPNPVRPFAASWLQAGKSILLPAGRSATSPACPASFASSSCSRQRHPAYQVECEAGLLTVDCLNRRAGDLLPVGSAVTLVGGPGSTL